MFLLVPAHPGCPGQFPQSRKTVVCVCVKISASSRSAIIPHLIDGTKKILTNTHTQPFYSSIALSGTTQISQHQNKHSPAHTHRGHQSPLSASSI